MADSASPLARQLAAEAVGTFFLLATVVGSGIMGESLAGGNVAIALLGNTVATGAILVVLISVFGPVSGAHFNPAVTVAFLVRGDLPAVRAGAFIAVQVIAAVAGVIAAHAMFDQSLLQTSTNARSSVGQWIAEFIATFGLLMTILGCLRSKPDVIPFAVGLYITAGYWFTASTSFANPAVTIARTMTDTFSGILPVHAPAFIVAQLLGALAAVFLITRIVWNDAD